jgi:A/G-specific adenine glycosylase
MKSWFESQNDSVPKTKQIHSLPQEAQKFRSQLGRWFARNARDLPWRRTRDPYAILVSEMMLQQTQVVTVIDYYDRWMKHFPDVPSLAFASEEDVLHVWQGLGYYLRARNLHRTARIVATEYGGIFPRDTISLHRLPGIGRYTAGAVASFAFDSSVPIVDTNIARVLARLFDLRTPINQGPGHAALWLHAESLLPKKGAGIFNAALMELGAIVCTQRAPKCGICPVHNFCRAESPEQIPVRKVHAPIRSLVENCSWISHGNRLLLEKQTGSRWHGLWKLPQICEQGTKLTKPILQLNYPFTNHRVALSIFKTRRKKLQPNQEWHHLHSLPAMSAPHLRAVNQLCSSAPGKIPSRG